MAMTPENQPIQESTEKSTQSRVGLRLQDVIMRINTANQGILSMRDKIQDEIKLTEAAERIVVLDCLSKNLMGTNLLGTLEEASKILIPYHNNDEKKKTLIVSSASSSSASQETECAILKTRGHVIDIPGAIEGRDTRSAQDGDIALISTRAGLMMAEARGRVEIINLTDEIVVNLTPSQELKGSDIYYKADGLLLLMLTNPTSPVITKLTDELTKNPLVYPYNLDEETQIALLWLSKKARVNRIDVNANSPEVGIELTRKGYRYPNIEDALKLPNYPDPYQMQTEEWRLSQSASEIGYHPDYVPGYVINRQKTYDEFYVNTLIALELLASRYGLVTAWVKPDRGTDGGGQGQLTTDTSQNQEIEAKIQEMWKQDGNWVVEAKTNYFKIMLPLDGIQKTLMTTPSVHVIKGEPKYTISVQLVDGVSWGGNLICSKNTWEHLVDMVDPTDSRIIKNPGLISQLKASYNQMPKAMHNYVDAINRSEKYKNGQVRGGADLAVATLGGKFGHDRVIVAVQDYNARANGCETAYALYDQAQEIYGEIGEAITRNITPKADFNTFSAQLSQIIEKVNTAYNKNISLDQVKLIAVSAGWGQFGMIGKNPIEITQNILLLELELRKSGLIQ